MLLGNKHVHLRRGPRENNFRPAIDPLFRSAAIYHGTRTIAGVLSDPKLKGDALHPNAEGHARLAAKIYKELQVIGYAGI